MARVKGQHQTIAIHEEGVGVLAGSFAKVETFEPVAKADLTEDEFIGEQETDFDIQHHGWGGTFTIHESEKGPLLFYQRIVDANAAGKPIPKLSLICVTKYVDPAAGVVTESYSPAIIKLSGRPNSGRKSFLKNNFEFVAKRRKVT